MINLVKEKTSDPCCEKCGQSLPPKPPLPLTLREKIDRLRSEWGANPRVRRVSIFFVIHRILDILEELESRQVTFTPLPPNQTPWPTPFSPNVYPRPTTGDPLPSQRPTVTCRNSGTAVKTTFPHAMIESVNAVTRDS